MRRAASKGDDDVADIVDLRMKRPASENDLIAERLFVAGNGGVSSSKFKLSKLTLVDHRLGRLSDGGLGDTRTKTKQTGENDGVAMFHSDSSRTI